ncbi:MAG: endonuclease/exonuclease/phosphatase [Gemmatimonadetes bacterium]|nr:MAG: endonuclease/exonuclease/phosphatase [Gemmatimonadota bacterium]
MNYRHAFASVLPRIILGSGLAACAGQSASPTLAKDGRVRVATFNIFELSTAKLARAPSDGRLRDTQVVAAADIIQAVRPDILLLNEIDALPSDPAHAARRFAMEVLAVGPHAVRYPYVYSAETNTGELSGFDLNLDEKIATTADVGSRAYGDDSWGYGTYPGQYGMAILSRFPIDTARLRSFRLMRWKDLPDALLPSAFYGDSVADQFRLSSKSHWDVPIVVGNDTLHLLASHPTPPVFDGPEDRNGRRNFDEVGFWLHFLNDSRAIVDDRGRRGGMMTKQPFVIVGDLNASPEQRESQYRGGPAIMQLLRDARIQDPPQHQRRPTATFGGGTRVDYVLPSVQLTIVNGGVEWPDSTSYRDGARRAALASDHRLVWLDLRFR